MQTHEEFFTDAQCQSLYKQLANAIVTRTNSINGRRLACDLKICVLDLCWTAAHPGCHLHMFMPRCCNKPGTSWHLPL